MSAVSEPSKVCKECGLMKVLSEYHKDSKGGMGCKARCKVCQNQWTKSRRSGGLLIGAGNDDNKSDVAPDGVIYLGRQEAPEETKSVNDDISSWKNWTSRYIQRACPF